MTNISELNEQDFEKFNYISEEAWQNIDYLDFKSALYYLSNDIPGGEIEALCGEINGLEITVSIYFKSIFWDSLKFQEYRHWRACRKREKYEVEDTKRAVFYDGIGHYVYLLSQGKLPTDRPSVSERFESSLNKTV